LPPQNATTTINLVRHGETDWNLNRRYQGWEDIPLNDTGREQAQLVAQAIAREPRWDAIYSSPLSRALSTAQAIAELSGMGEIVQDPDLRERFYGEAEGLTSDEREAKWPGLLAWPGLERQDVMTARAMSALERVAERHVGGRVLVIAHGGLINAVLHQVSGGEVGTGITIILNTARTMLLRNGTGWEIETVTDTSHLELAAALER
jgi:broad specificity phosphatase PhoE